MSVNRSNHNSVLSLKEKCLMPRISKKTAFVTVPCFAALETARFCKECSVADNMCSMLQAEAVLELSRLV